MKHWIATFAVSIGLLFAAPLAQAAEVEKEPLNLQEITELVTEEQVDRQQLEDIDAGFESGAGLLIIAIIALGIVVASN